MKEKIMKAAAVALLLAGSVPALAHPFNFMIQQRDPTDMTYQYSDFPEYVASTSPVLLGTRGDMYNSAYFYIGRGLKLVQADPDTQGADNKVISLDMDSIDYAEIPNLYLTIANKASQSDLDAASSTIYSQGLSISSLNTFGGNFFLNMQGSGTAYQAASSTNRNGFMRRDQSLKLDSMSTSTASTSTNGYMSFADKIKLNALSTSTATSVAQIQADWAQASTTATDYIKNKPVRTFTNPSRSLNTAFMVSTTTVSTVIYSISIANTLTLSGGAAGVAILEYADDSGFTTNVKEAGRVGNSNSGGLVVGITLNDQITVQLMGMIPSGKYARIRTSNATGTPTYTVVTAQEVY